MKRNKLTLGILALGLIALVSCREQEEATPTQSDMETNPNPKTTVALNPAHGLPGHRCELPVGAPLDGSKISPSDNSIRSVQNTPAINPNVSPVRVKSATPTKNPPHGQPGHDCSIPVGADLK